MADKITNFEDYIKRSDSVNTEKEPRDSAGTPAGTGTVKNGDTGFIESIEIVDPYNFFTEEEREEYFRERQKAEQTSSDAPIVVEQSEEATETPVPDPSTFAGMLASGQVSSIRVIGDSITAGFRLE